MHIVKKEYLQLMHFLKILNINTEAVSGAQILINDSTDDHQTQTKV